MTKRFRTDVLRKSDQVVSKEYNKITNVAIATTGEAKGHGVSLDQDFIENIARLGNEKSKGIKARFGHPAMSGDALGTFLGRWTNFRTENNIARADLTISETAQSSPSGNLSSYIFDMAEKESDMFGASIVFEPGRYYKKDEDNNKIYPRDQEYVHIDGPEYIEIKKLHAADLVDEPAANEGLFSKWSGNTIASKVSDFLDENPVIYSLVEKHPDIIQGFMERYKQYTNRDIEVNMDKKDKKDIDTQVEIDNPENIELSKGNESIDKDKTANELREELRFFIKEFGIEFGVYVFLECISSAEAYAQYSSKLKEEKDELQKKLKDQYQLGEDPVDTNIVDDNLNPSNAKIQEKYNELKTKLNNNIAKFASGIKFEGE